MLNWHLVFIYQSTCRIGVFFYPHKQLLPITAISHQNAYKEVFWLKYPGGACPRTPQTAGPANCAPRAHCALRWNRTAKYHDAFSFFGGKPWYPKSKIRTLSLKFEFWCLKFKVCIVFLQICRNMMQSSQQTRGIHPILFQCWASDSDAGQHWNSIGWMPCVCWAVSLRPNTCA